MQAVSELGRALAVQVQRAFQGGFGLEVEFLRLEQSIEGPKHSGPVESIARPEHPFKFQHDGAGDEQGGLAGASGLEQLLRAGRLIVVVLHQPAHQHVGVQAGHQLRPMFMSWIATLRLPPAGFSIPLSSRTERFWAA